MQTAYRQRGNPRRRRTNGTLYLRNADKLLLEKRERRRVLQLVVCMIIFLLSFACKGLFPEQLYGVRGPVQNILSLDTDFVEVFTRFGRNLSNGEPVGSALGGLCVEVFGIGGGILHVSYVRPWAYAEVYQAERVRLSAGGIGARSEVRLGMQSFYSDAAQGAEKTHQEDDEGKQNSGDSIALLPPEPQAVKSEGKPPENVSFQYCDLNLKNTVTPVAGVVSSKFGYRLHPIDDEERFHYGIDIAADRGTAIQAFADGVVDYIGESGEYGQYVRLSHGDRVTSFYAHCSKLHVRKGQKIKLGQKIAEVGDTGKTTGPHLHLEIRLDGVYLDPAHYIRGVL